MRRPEEQLEVYLVGGAVRDRLMGLDVESDRDWMVVGSSPEQMVELGFRPIGSDFPVFLHPTTHEQYALARTERKIGRGYHGFVFNCDPKVSVEDDLGRRDLTMNAIAMDKEENLIDPFGGASDINNRIIRHVSEAFREDPVRILRTARFAARFRSQGFSVANQTLKMMSDMVDNGEVDALIPERIWQELANALAGPNIAEFILTLKRCKALKSLLPEIDKLFGIPQTAKYHPEIDTGIHILMCLDAVEKITNDPMTRFAVLVHDLGKAVTPTDILPSHHKHEINGLAPITGLCERLKVPVSYRQFALMVCRHHLEAHRIAKMKPGKVLKILEKINAFRSPEMIKKFKQCCLADSRGRAGYENSDALHLELLDEYQQIAISVDQADIAATVQSSNRLERAIGPEIKKRIREERIRRISQFRK
ncbi:MAG: multifunctional CCA addition/repair protein [Gammaproteobacteria bacterium]|nr:multifunctional CCA addition/repair protein [Gammaproteobacteria bacterium]MCY4219241.1 multifunctional CCA addition/repair protein [Gammaproteobacteria bacterium]MCY4274770.1 multifunctional CCA addition/repair protein [Gammaproteobacteria bacterium]